jgi:hypothetical protein
MSDAFPIAFGRYQLVERLAVGGMAELFKARVVGVHGFQKPVVIKKILPHLAADASFVAMFIDEANITARLDHPKIAQVLDLGTIDDQLYIAMEFVDGIDTLALLRACAQKKQALPTTLAVHISHEVLDALDYAHKARDDAGKLLGIVHRDISPSNVLLARRGDVKLADFGIAHAVERQQKTQAGTLKGKYGYMSPEQVVGGELDGRSDLFSVGIVLAEMLMGRRLFTAPNELDVLLMVRDVRLDRLDKYGAAIEPDLRKVLVKSLAREPDERFVDAAAFRDALDEWLFAKRHRVGAGDVATFIEPIVVANQAARPARAADEAAQASAGAAAGSGSGAEPRRGGGTLAGPSTKARELQAEEQKRLARAELAARKAAASAPPEPPAAPPTPPPTQRASQRAATVPARPATADPIPPSRITGGDISPSRISSDIPITVDHAAGGESGPVVVIERAATPAAAPTPDTRRDETDFSDLGLELELPASSKPRPRPVGTAPPEALVLEPSLELPSLETAPSATVGSAGPEPPRESPRVGTHTEKPDQEGDLSRTPAIRILYKLAVEKQSGLLLVEISGITKEIFFVAGVPEFVSSNVARELFGEYLVAQKVVSAGELAMALAMMPHFGGKLGDTLVGLGLMKPLDVFRHLTRQVRDKIVDVCTWQKGRFRWFRGKRNPREAFPLGLDAFEVLGAGATALPAEVVEAWTDTIGDRLPLAAKNPRVVPEAFRLGTYPRDVYNRLDGRLKVRDFAARFSDAGDRLAFLRTLYLLVQTELAYLQ